MKPIVESFDRYAGHPAFQGSHWTRFLTRFPRRKLRLVRWAETGNVDPCTQEALDYFQAHKDLQPGGFGLITYLGFARCMGGWVWRNLKDKQFSVWTTSQPPLYIAEAWDFGIDKYRRSETVAVTEGILDCEVLREISGHAPCCAQLGSSLSWRSAMFLGLIADRVLLVPDADKAGRAGSMKSRKTLTDLGIKCEILDDTSGFKDVAELWDTGDDFDRIKYRAKFLSAVETC